MIFLVAEKVRAGRCPFGPDRGDLLGSVLVLGLVVFVTFRILSAWSTTTSSNPIV
jgi:hypothetical protein